MINLLVPNQLLKDFNIGKEFVGVLLLLIKRRKKKNIQKIIINGDFFKVKKFANRIFKFIFRNISKMT